MAKLWIREYRKIPRVGASRGALGTSYEEGSPMAMEPGTDQATLTFSGSVASAAFASTTTFIGVISDVAFHYVVGGAPTATTGALKVPADTLLFMGVTGGQKIAAIAAV